MSSSKLAALLRLRVGATFPLGSNNGTALIEGLVLLVGGLILILLLGRQINKTLPPSEASQPTTTKSVRVQGSSSFFRTTRMTALLVAVCLSSSAAGVAIEHARSSLYATPKQAWLQMLASNASYDLGFMMGAKDLTLEEMRTASQAMEFGRQQQVSEAVVRGLELKYDDKRATSVVVSLQEEKPAVAFMVSSLLSVVQGDPETVEVLWEDFATSTREASVKWLTAARALTDQYLESVARITTTFLADIELYQINSSDIDNLFGAYQARAAELTTVVDLSVIIRESFDWVDEMIHIPAAQKGCEAKLNISAAFYSMMSRLQEEANAHCDRLSDEKTGIEADRFKLDLVYLLWKVGKPVAGFLKNLRTINPHDPTQASSSPVDGDHNDLVQHDPLALGKTQNDSPTCRETNLGQKNCPAADGETKNHILRFIYGVSLTSVSAIFLRRVPSPAVVVQWLAPDRPWNNVRIWSSTPVGVVCVGFFLVACGATTVLDIVLWIIVTAALGWSLEFFVLAVWANRDWLLAIGLNIWIHCEVWFFTVVPRMMLSFGACIRRLAVLCLRFLVGTPIVVLRRNEAFVPPEAAPDVEHGHAQAAFSMPETCNESSPSDVALAQNVLLELLTGKLTLEEQRRVSRTMELERQLQISEAVLAGSKLTYDGIRATSVVASLQDEKPGVALLVSSCLVVLQNGTDQVKISWGDFVSSTREAFDRRIDAFSALKDQYQQCTTRISSFSSDPEFEHDDSLEFSQACSIRVAEYTQVMDKLVIVRESFDWVVDMIRIPAQEGLEGSNLNISFSFLQMWNWLDGTNEYVDKLSDEKAAIADMLLKFERLFLLRKAREPVAVPPAHGGTFSENDRNVLHCFNEETQTLYFLQSYPLVTETEGGTPQPTTLLDVEKEANDLKEALEEATKEGHARIKLKIGIATIDEKSKAFTLGGDRPRLIHYSGHGGKKSLPLEDGFGGTKPVDVGALGKWVTSSGGGHLKLVFVAACHSEGPAGAFLKAGVPHVVCCRLDDQLRDGAAMVFTRNFYRALVSHKSVKQAFNLACETVGLGSTEEARKYKLLPEKSPEDPYHDVVLFPKHSSPAIEISDPRTEGLSMSRRPPQNFMGRQLDMYQVLQNLRDKQIVHLTGQDGIGRATLAVAIGVYVAARKSAFGISDIIWLPSKPGDAGDELYEGFSKVYSVLMDYGSTNLDWFNDATNWGKIRSGLKERQALLILDARSKKAIDLGQRLLSFLSELMVVGNCKVLLIGVATSGLPEDHVTHEVLPLNFESSATLFCNHSDKPVKLFARCGKAETAETLLQLLLYRPLDPTALEDDKRWPKRKRIMLPDREKRLLELIGGGNPKKVRLRSDNFTEEDIQKLFDIARDPENEVDSRVALEQKIQDAENSNDSPKVRELKKLRSEFPTLDALKQRYAQVAPDFYAVNQTDSKKKKKLQEEMAYLNDQIGKETAEGNKESDILAEKFATAIGALFSEAKSDEQEKEKESDKPGQDEAMAYLYSISLPDHCNQTDTGDKSKLAGFFSSTEG